MKTPHWNFRYDSCSALQLCCEALAARHHVPFSSAACSLLYSTGFETTWPGLSCGEQVQLGRCSANWSNFNSGRENTCCAVGVSSVAGNFAVEHACIGEMEDHPEVIISPCCKNQECGLKELLYVCLTSNTRGNWFRWFVIRQCAPH